MVKRELSIEVKNNEYYSNIFDVITSVKDKEFDLIKLELKYVYTDNELIRGGNRVMELGLEFQGIQNNITKEQVNNFMDRVIDVLTNNLDVKLR